MASFPDAYDIPDDIRALVRGEQEAPNFLSMMLQLAPAKARKNAEMYHKSFTTKLFLEEEHGLFKKFERYNIDNILIQHFRGRKFCFKIDVS